MHRTRLLAPFVSVLALAACSTDKPDLVAPPVSASLSVQSSGAPNTSGRYIVLATNAGFGSDFTKQVKSLGGKVDRMHGTAGLAAVSGLTASAATQMARLGGVSDVQPDIAITLDKPVAALRDAASVVSTVSASNTADPSKAILFSWQWNMRLIHANDAWSHGKLGDSHVKVAIIDTGIDYDEPDLTGLVDLSSSTSFVPSDDSITTALFPTRNNISDYNGHGTNVSTQVSSNAFAFAGVTSRTTLMGVKVLGADGSGLLSGVLQGVLWAADHDADVANLSLGGSFPRPHNGRYIGLINRVFSYASRKGMLIVVAAGNDASDLDHNGNTFVGYCDAAHVICVSAVGPPTGASFATSGADTPAFYTNFGVGAIDVAGPGGNADAADGFPASPWPWGLDIASWVWSFCSKTTLTLDANGAVIGLAGCQAGNQISGDIGTSQATPHVSGLAALLVARNGHARPQQIKQQIQKSADDLGPPGVDAFYGHGRINVARALNL